MLKIIFKYFLCIWCNSLIYIIGTLAKKCNVLDVYDEHVTAYHNLESFSHYIPRQSCFICLESTCQLGAKGCDAVELTDLPLYHNMLEFGFFGNDLPRRGFIRVPMSKACYFQIEMRVNFGNAQRETDPRVTFYFWKCQYHDHECVSRHVTKPTAIERNGCIFISVMLNRIRFDQIYVSVSYDCMNLASAVRTKEQYLDIQRKQCYFTGFEEVPNINFQFFPNSNRRHDGLVLILPCSPGGYVVNPFNGRFVFDYFCKTLFFPEVHGDAVEQIIDQQYDGNENLQFPSKVRATREQEFRPVYIAENGKTRSASEMKPIPLAQEFRGPSLFRDRCDLYSRLPFISINDAVGEIENFVISTRVIDFDTSIPFARTVTKTKGSKTTKSKTTRRTRTTRRTETDRTRTKTDVTRRTTASATATTTNTTTTNTTVPPGATYLPDADPVKEVVQVTYKNQSSDTLFTFERERGVFSLVKTLSPGDVPSPTPEVPIWTPDYDTVLETRITHGEKMPHTTINYTRHHEPVIRIMNQTQRKQDNIFARFDRDDSEVTDYFANLTPIQIDIASGTILQDCKIHWVYKLLFLISIFLLCFTFEATIYV